MKNGQKSAAHIRIALNQCSMRLGDVGANLSKLSSTVKEAARAKAALLVGPELGLTGYHLKDAVPDAAIRRGDAAWKDLERLSKSVDLAVGFVEQSSGHQYYNTAAYFSGGRAVHLHRKIYLPTYGMFDEQRYFARGAKVETFDSAGGRSALLICEDLWHPSTVYLASLQGLELLIVPSSSPMRGAVAKKGPAAGRAEKSEKPGAVRRPASAVTWEEMNRTYARLYSVALVYVNRVGVEDGVGFSGGSHFVDPFGSVALQLPYGEEALQFVDFDRSQIRRSRVQTPIIRDENFELTFSEMERIRRSRWKGDPE